jgi:crotonobetainyl-CoA:carnitine CoA-transferase CaiB-like acyl-CoA transferase
MTDKEAFGGIRVLDLSQGIAGPHGGMLLAQHGADVIKVEPIAGDWGRTLGRPYGQNTAHSIAFNRGKRSIALDLTKPRGLEVARMLMKQSDVVIEAFRPGVMAKYGLAYEDAKAANPGIIYLSINGFGSQGPNAMLPVTDAVIQAFSGLMTVARSSDGVPNRLTMIPVDVVTGLYAFQSVATALVRKFRFGTGSYIEASLMQAAAAFQAAKIMEYHLERGEPQPLYSPVATMRTSDGYLNVTAMRENHFLALCEVIGRPELAADPGYQGRELRIKNEASLLAILRSEFTKQPTAYWARKLTAAGVMNASVQTYGDFLDHPQTKSLNVVEYVEHPGVGTIAVAQIPGTPPVASQPISRSRSPLIGEHTAEILAEIGFDEAEIRAMQVDESIAVQSRA